MASRRTRPSHGSVHGWPSSSRLALGFWLAACGGTEFSSGASAPECESSCGGEESGGPSGTAGEPGQAGSDDAGVDGGGASRGGSSPAAGGASSGAGPRPGGSAGASLGGLGGLAGATNGFPRTPVLDSFNRNGAELGADWLGATEEFALKQQAAWCETCARAVTWSKPFGGEQEVFATLAGFDDGASEINLVLKAQGATDCDMIEVIYSPASLSLRIAYCNDRAWTDLEPLSVLFEPGDRLGARAHADGAVELFKNGKSLTRVDVSAFPFELGRIGLNGVSGDNGLSWDDFGGGNWR
jgi:hypothetical protein